MDAVPSKINHPAPTSAKTESTASVATPKGSSAQNDLYKRLDQAGPFAFQMSGALEKEAFMKMRSVINEHVMLEFKDMKERLMAKRLEAYKKQN